MKNTSFDADLKVYLHWLEELSRAGTAECAVNALNRFAFTVVYNEAVTPAAARLIPAVLERVPDATPYGRAAMFDLLYEFGAGYSDFEQSIHYAAVELERNCRFQIMLGASQYFYYFEKGAPIERLSVIWLLDLCARTDNRLAQRVIEVFGGALRQDSEPKLDIALKRCLQDLDGTLVDCA